MRDDPAAIQAEIDGREAELAQLRARLHAASGGLGRSAVRVLSIMADPRRDWTVAEASLALAQDDLASALGRCPIGDVASARARPVERRRRPNPVRARVHMALLAARGLIARSGLRGRHIAWRITPAGVRALGGPR